MTELTKLIADFDVNVAGNHITSVDTTRQYAVDASLAESKASFETMLSGAVNVTNKVTQRLLEEIGEAYAPVQPGTEIAEQKFIVPLTHGLAVQAAVHQTVRGGVPSAPGEVVKKEWFGVTTSVNMTPSKETVSARKDAIARGRSGN